MLRILHDTKLDFIKHWRGAVVVTAAFVLIGFGAAFVNGWFKYSIEFTSGTMIQLEFKEAPDVARLRATIARAGVHGAQIQQFGSPTTYTIKAQESELAQVAAAGAEGVSKVITQALRAELGTDSFEIADRMTVGPRVGSELRRGAVIAVFVSFLVTMAYLAFRFEWRFGVSAVMATAHDILATLAFIKLLDLEISLTVVAAILTVVGYSLNDTIIIFDRVRENLHKKRKESLYDTLNRSVNETLPRSVITHGTTLAATLSLLFFGGEVLRPFAWVMSFGIFTGTFSSIYVASPILMWVEAKWPRDNEARTGQATVRA